MYIIHLILKEVPRSHLVNELLHLLTLKPGKGDYM